MSKKNSKQIVIDANLAYASGNLKFNPVIGPAGAIAADRNRQCLQAIFDEGHIAVFGRRLYEEWTRHSAEGSYAQDWFKLMMRQSRIEREDGSSFAALADPACACLSADGEKAALAKDFHLIQSALATGQLFLSNEIRFTKYVALASQAVPELASLHYANPGIEGEQCRLWIKAGAEKEADRRIDMWVENHLKSG